MKDIGRTNDGNYLVEMSDAEHQTFATLEIVAGGKEWAMAIANHYRMWQNMDMAPVFASIRAWMEARYQVTQLRTLADDLGRCIGETLK